jgi:hypothetical protein
VRALFVKEIEESLAGGDVDVGVHSMKDLPAHLAPELVLGSVPARADARIMSAGRRAGSGARGREPRRDVERPAARAAPPSGATSTWCRSAARRHAPRPPRARRLD